MGGCTCQGVVPARGGCTCQGGCTCRGVVYLPGGGVPGRGVNLLGGCTCQRGGVPARGVYLPGGCTCWGCTCLGGHTCPGGCTCWGVPGLGVPGGGCTWLGGCTWSGTPTPHPVNRMTDRCKNITLAKTSFRPVNILYSIGGTWMWPTGVYKCLLKDSLQFHYHYITLTKVRNTKILLPIGILPIT